jgi:hypothetical protein
MPPPRDSVSPRPISAIGIAASAVSRTARDGFAAARPIASARAGARPAASWFESPAPPASRPKVSPAAYCSTESPPTSPIAALSTGPSASAVTIQTRSRSVRTTVTIAIPTKIASAARTASSCAGSGWYAHRIDAVAQPSSATVSPSHPAWRQIAAGAPRERRCTTRIATSAAPKPARRTALPAGKNELEKAGIHSASASAGLRIATST